MAAGMKNEEAEQLAQLEKLCEAFYSGSLQHQQEAHAVLLPLVADPTGVPRLQTILARSTSPAALMFAASGLLKLFSGCWNRIPDQEKDDTRKFVLNYLYSNGPDLLRSSPVLLNHLVRLLVRIVKLAWLESIQNQNITQQVEQFLQASTPHWVVGLTIYTELTHDMQPSSGAQMARNRRTALSFRDTALAEIFKVAVHTLQQFHSGAMHIADPVEQGKLLRQVLQLCLNCLGYDFMGTMNDDSNDEQTNVMIPHTWTILKQENFVGMLYDIYTKSWTDPNGPRPQCARLCLRALVLTAAIRRSFFSKDNERSNFVVQLMEGSAQIVVSGLGLQDDDCYHEICRLVGKINAANQVSELSKLKGFDEWLDQLAAFTMRSLENWRHLPNSKHYLVGIWAGLVGPASSLRGKLGPIVIDYIYRITGAFIQSRMRMAEALADDNGDADFENPLTDSVMRTEQLEVFTVLSRCCYLDVARIVLDLFNEVEADVNANRIAPNVFQSKCAWLVYIIGALLCTPTECRIVIPTKPPLPSALNGNNTTSSLSGNAGGLNDIEDELTKGGVRDEEQEEDDSTETDKAVAEMSSKELATKVLEFIKKTDGLPNGSETLELAYIYFLEQFRRTCIGEYARQSTVVYAEDHFSVLGRQSTPDVMTMIVEKICFNLKARVAMEEVVKRSLTLFLDLATGVSVVQAYDRLPHFVVCGRLVLKCPSVIKMLDDHQNNDLVFLRVPRLFKYRTLFYATLTKLLILEVKENFSDGLTSFLKPQAEIAARLLSDISARGGAEGLKTAEAKTLIIQLCRDLRGLSQACVVVDSYTALFDWLVDKPKVNGGSKINIFPTACEVYWDDHEVMIPLLKFMAEFVLNRNSRITFPSSSPNGILLFKVVSGILISYGSRILSRPIHTDVYRQKYKGLATALDMFSAALAGDYTNFGVFELYNDVTLSDAISLGLRMCLSIPSDDLQAYIKALKPVYPFLDLVARTFPQHLFLIDPSQTAQLMRCLEDGLCNFQPGIAMQSCTTVDSVVYYIYTKRMKTDDEGQAIQRFLTCEHGSLKRILQLMFQLVLSGEVASTWSMSRPLLGLVLLYMEDFEQIKEQFIHQQVADRQEKLRGYFSDLMSNIEPSLTEKNRDAFTRNLYNFAQCVRSSFT